MLDPDYLKIDQSKLPLEIFDNIEFEQADLPPSEWLASRSNGKAPYFINGKWLWRPVEVLGMSPTHSINHHSNSLTHRSFTHSCSLIIDHNAASNQYTVHFLPDGISKLVHRLNLLFDIEDESKFNERRRVATVARNEAKEQMRLDHFVDRQSRESIRPINKDSIKRMHTKVVEGLSVTVSYSHSLTVWSTHSLLVHRYHSLNQALTWVIF